MEAVVHPKQFYIEYRTNVGNCTISAKSSFVLLLSKLNQKRCYKMCTTAFHIYNIHKQQPIQLL